MGKGCMSLYNDNGGVCEVNDLVNLIRTDLVYVYLVLGHRLCEEKVARG